MMLRIMMVVILVIKKLPKVVFKIFETITKSSIKELKRIMNSHDISHNF